LNRAFHLDAQARVNSASDGDLLVAAIQGVMETMAMVDYPYEANFLAPLPPWPVKVACKNYNSKAKKSAEDYALASYELLNLFYNSTGQLSSLCLFGNGCSGGPFAELGDPDGW
jgi:lysosomal Pro-X carboxypeptidase